MHDRIEKRIELKAPIARAWRAISDYREFGAWFGVKLTAPVSTRCRQRVARKRSAWTATAGRTR